MPFKDFKNTVLFPIISGIILIAISCGNKVRSKVGSSKDEVGISKLESKNKRLVDSTIIVGANQTEIYLPLLKNKRVGIVANQTSVVFKQIGTTSEKSRNNIAFTHLVDSLLSLGINITKVFSPEHGFRGKADAGELVKDGIDTKTQLPIFSLHGKHKKPTKTQLADLDIVVFDIQDVGVRFYTYISTLHYVMEACAEHNIPVLILDRPNPNGSYIDGPVLEQQNSSFLGMHTIPLIHGMTIGEYARMINGEGWLNNAVKCNITVVEMKNYDHNSTYSLPIRPSPNLPNDQSITLYPSLGLFEGTNVNAGRGTEFQFQRYGAPFLNKNHYKFSYTPVSNFGAKYPKHENTLCYGVDLANIKAKRHFTLKYIIDAYNYATDKSKVFNTSNFTTHAGTKKLQQQIEAGLSEAEIKASWQNDIDAYKKMREAYLIYE